MAFKQFALDERTNVTIYKRRSSRNLRLSIAADGSVRVSIPTWAPYRAGLEFAKARRTWIDEQSHEQPELMDGQAVGKAHRLRFVADNSKTKPSSRLKAGEVVITYPGSIEARDPSVQKLAKTAAARALRSQAESLLPQRLALLAGKYDFDYRSVAVKQLKGRWGSCDSQKNIVLNLYLMQLPWDLIDYVLLHELTHTRILRHGPDFWRAMEAVLPNAKALKKSIRDYKPVL